MEKLNNSLHEVKSEPDPSNYSVSDIEDNKKFSKDDSIQYDETNFKVTTIQSNKIGQTPIYYFTKMVTNFFPDTTLKTDKVLKGVQTYISNELLNGSLYSNVKSALNYSQKNYQLILIGLPCLAILSLPLFLYFIILFLAALPVLSFAPCILFASLPFIWPQIKTKFQSWPIPQGIIMMLAFILIPILFLFCIPICLFSPIALLFVIPWLIVIMAIIMLILFPILTFVSLLMGIIAIIYLSPITSQLKTKFLNIWKIDQLKINSH